MDSVTVYHANSPQPATELGVSLGINRLSLSVKATPTEVWCRIFEFVATGAFRHVLLLCKICRRWREIAITCGSLWNNIVVFNPRVVHITMVEMWCRRAGAYPLSVDIFASYTHLRSTTNIAVMLCLFSLIMAQTNTLHSFSFTYPATLITPTTLPTPSAFTCLRKLVLQCADYSEDAARYLISLFREVQLTRLECGSLHNVLAPPPILFDRPTNSLTHLRVDVASPADVPLLLSRCPRLLTLDVFFNHQRGETVGVCSFETALTCLILRGDIKAKIALLGRGLFPNLTTVDCGNNALDDMSISPIVLAQQTSGFRLSKLTASCVGDSLDQHGAPDCLLALHTILGHLTYFDVSLPAFSSRIDQVLDLPNVREMVIRFNSYKLLPAPFVIPQFRVPNLGRLRLEDCSSLMDQVLDHLETSNCRLKEVSIKLHNNIRPNDVHPIRFLRAPFASVEILDITGPLSAYLLELLATTPTVFPSLACICVAPSMFCTDFIHRIRMQRTLIHVKIAVRS
ncbi:hypothetical protein VNI00_015657 [Paramarasmius palmivorus]|uniref:F-box domain-containing protein n=1 Tax=Paramarasmius palmivorus TaxID=297713 RepID=A0AAW0BJW1_9AGAR